VITISVPALTAANADSGADVEVSGMSGDAVTLNASSGARINARAATGASYDLNASSGSNLSVEGTCGQARVVVSSGAAVRADRLLFIDVDANASSGADADVHAGGSFKGVERVRNHCLRQSRQPTGRREQRRRHPHRLTAPVAAGAGRTRSCAGARRWPLAASRPKY
jgi:hypothetical protein